MDLLFFVRAVSNVLGSKKQTRRHERGPSHVPPRTEREGCLARREGGEAHLAPRKTHKSKAQGSRRANNTNKGPKGTQTKAYIPRRDLPPLSPPSFSLAQSPHHCFNNLSVFIANNLFVYAKERRGGGGNGAEQTQ